MAARATLRLNLARPIADGLHAGHTNLGGGGLHPCPRKRMITLTLSMQPKQVRECLWRTVQVPDPPH